MARGAQTFGGPPGVGSFSPPTTPPVPAPPVPGKPPGKPLYGIVSLVAGVLAIALPLIFSGVTPDDSLLGGALFFSLGLGIVAIVFGALGIKRAGTVGSGAERGLSIAGLVLGILITAGAVVLIIVVLIIIATCANAVANCGSTAAISGSSALRRDTPRPRTWHEWTETALAHHPDCGAYASDVYRVAGARFCVGCFTAAPVFLVAWAALALARPEASWGQLAGLGALLALPQAASVLGWTRGRLAKIVTKASFGLGAALIVHGVLTGPWSETVGLVLLVGLSGLLQAGLTLRRRRMEAVCRGHTHAAVPSAA